MNTLSKILNLFLKFYSVLFFSVSGYFTGFIFLLILYLHTFEHYGGDFIFVGLAFTISLLVEILFAVLLIFEVLFHVINHSLPVRNMNNFSIEPYILFFLFLGLLLGIMPTLYVLVIFLVLEPLNIPY